MSGTIKIAIRPGVCRHPKYRDSKYPTWYLKGIDESGISYTLAPSEDTICEIVKDIILHERKVDMIMDRNPYASITIGKFWHSIYIGKNKEIKYIEDEYYRCFLER